MRHGKKFNHLGRKKGHRKALLKNLSNALITHKRINTTIAKAKALRVFIEPLVTKAKTNTTHSRRIVFGYLQNKEATTELFGPIAAKVGTRPGGYVRIIKTGFRKSDGAEMAMIEFVDFNELLLNVSKDANKKTSKKKRTRRAGKKDKEATAAAATAATATVEETITEEVEELKSDQDVSGEEE